MANANYLLSCNDGLMLSKRCLLCLLLLLLLLLLELLVLWRH